jgi:hypothetical protein
LQHFSSAEDEIHLLCIITPSSGLRIISLGFHICEEVRLERLPQNRNFIAVVDGGQKKADVFWLRFCVRRSAFGYAASSGEYLPGHQPTQQVMRRSSFVRPAE